MPLNVLGLCHDSDEFLLLGVLLGGHHYIDWAGATFHRLSLRKKHYKLVQTIAQNKPKSSNKYKKRRGTEATVPPKVPRANTTQIDIKDFSSFSREDFENLYVSV